MEETKTYLADSVRKSQEPADMNNVKQEVELKHNTVLDEDTYVRLVNKLAA